ncbi:aldehyde dehydrogenase [Oscillospiraceae bacterium]|nr:aldehyde dehydrogenase [Oscillospiraceae bacterium]BDF73399.1 aldehyde dehydrogenase [Oscillospiraceae bacterium]
MFDVIGKSTPLIDGKAKVTGTAEFVRDLTVPHMLYGKTLKSPYPHAKILGIDVEEAKKVPGVVDVVTGWDIPGNDRAVGTSGDLAVLTTDKARFIGDEVAAVVAVDEKSADEALKKIKVEYEVLPTYGTMEEAMAGDVPIHEVDEDNLSLHVVTGNVERGLEDADLVVTETYRTQIVEHCPSDTEGVLASFDGTNLTVWANSQVPYWDKMMLGRIFRIPFSKVRVIVPCNGAPGGGRNVFRLLFIAAALSWKVRRPVKMIRNREEEFTCSSIRDAYTFDIRFGVNRDGSLVSMDCFAHIDSGAYIGWSHALGQAQGHLFCSLYKCPNMRYTYQPVFTNNSYGGPMRSFGNSEINFAVESTMDRIAKELNMDPVELRLKNAVEANYETAIGWKIQGCGLKECIVKANEEIRKGFQPSTDPRKIRSIGMACGVHWTGWRVGFNSFIWRTGFGSPEELYAARPDSPYLKLVDGKPQWRDGFWDVPGMDSDRSSCLLIVNEEGSVVLHVSDPDLGQGTYTVMAMIAAEELGISVNDVKVIGADTDSGVFGFGTYASRCTFVAGNAVQDAARKAKEVIAGYAADFLEEDPGLMVFRKGMVSVEGHPEKCMKLADATFRAYSTRNGELLSFKGSYDPGSIVPDKDGKGSISEAYPFLAQAVEIELDKETGEVKVLRAVSVHDSGRIINPIQAEGQVQGALFMGLGATLSEVIQRKDGRCINPNFTNYHLFSLGDLPDIQVNFVDQVEPNGPFGAKGLGEPALVCIPASIGNAIYNAVGVRVKELPITPPRVLGGIYRKELAEQEGK